MHTRRAIHHRSWSGLSLLAPLLASAALGCNQPPPPGSSGTVGDDETEADTDGETTDPSTSDGTDEPDTSDTEDTDATTTDPDDTDDTSDTSDTGEFDDTLYPLADGATWTYIAKNTNGQVLGMEIVNTTEIDWEGETAWMIVDNINAKGEWTESVIVRDGTLSSRVHKEIKSDSGTVMIVDYDPGFARVDDSWDTVDFSEEFFYDRTEYDGNGLNPSVEARAHIFTVKAVNEKITVPAGTFDCVQVERVRSAGGAAGEIVVSWYAYGVGKIREERPADSRIEELASVSLPGGVDLP
ncbi:TapB family protein [Enhygromyxa salina]|uniref:DUF3108 domain-containing protein n=1 Tax=Enhygromyxa salina TaxID=215803 RepID=A0A2S9XN63_9BACT|nr:hypothetical protein [Enhygromyxa salina]PRP94292.1 hypothetical protein ENSA7_78290 [Enhygromyxa salina]